MQTKNLQVKRALRVALFVLLLSLAGMTKMYAYGFSAVCETGQTLYYNVIDADNHYVEITCPNVPGNSAWGGYTKPIGNIIFPDSVQHGGITYTVSSIGHYAFYSCSGLTGNLTIPNSVITIGEKAFYDCIGFKGSLTIGNSVTTIGNSAFCGCSSLKGSLTIGNSVTTIGENAFGYCNSLTGSLTIPNSVTTIGRYAFVYCSGFTGSLTIPNSVTTIGGSAFKNCSGFTGNLNISNSVTTIDNQAFYDCSGFTGNLTIGSSVTTIGGNAFLGCSSFSLINSLAVTPPSVGSNAFYGVNHDLPVLVPCGTMSAYQSTSGWNQFTNYFDNCSMYLVLATANPAEGGIVTGTGTFEEGDTCTLIATPNEGYFFLNWTQNGNVVSTGTTYSFIVEESRSLVANFANGDNDNIVYNGDFELGNVGFTSSYQYTTNLNPQGTYYIGENANNYHSGFIGLAHGGTGNFMIINGATEHGINVWTEQVAVTPNTNYAFSTWVCNVGALDPNAVALLQFSINGVQLGEIFSCINELNVWEQFYVIWNSGNSTTATITILNQNTTPYGNDFGLDDIYFGLATAPYSINATPSPTEGGTVTGIGTYNHFDTCTLVATPNQGYLFEKWTKEGNVVSTSPTYSFIVTENATYVANFTWTNPVSTGYISDGLIMYFDGINNTRNGHSTTTSVWEDLMGNYDLTVNNYASYAWEDNHFIGLGDGGYLNTDHTWQYFNSLNDDLTIEIVTYIDCDKTSPAYRGIAGWHEGSDGTNIQNDQGNSRMQTLGGLPVSEADDMVATISYTKNNGSFLNGLWKVDDGRILLGVNSNYGVVFGNSYSSGRGWNDSIYCIRMYNRTLTSEEVAYNHSIDVERFGAGNGGSVPLGALNVSTHNINFGEVALNQSASATLNVEGVWLENNLNIEITGEDAAMFSFTEATNWNSLTGGDLNITFMPTSVQYDYHANLIVSSGTLTQTVALSGSVANVYDFNTYVDEEVYAMNTPIPIHGTVQDIHNAPVANVEVEIGIFVMGMKRTLQATTNGNGEFFATFEPLPTEAGYYTVNSGHVGNNSTEMHAYFNIPGMSIITDGYILCAVTQNLPKTDHIQLRNKSNLPLNINEVTVLSAPEGCSISFEPLSLNRLEEGNLVYTVNGTTITEGNYYQEIKLRVNSDEGATTDFSIWYYCMEPRGILNVTPKNITTTMTKGKSKIIDVMVSNHGTAATGEITIGLPNVEWMSVVGGNTLPSLAVNDSAYFSLRLSPGNDINLTQNTGTIIINCTHGEYADLQYDITAVSDSTGSLHVDVTDEYSYYSIRGPHLANAEVTLTGYYSLETYHDFTNADGTIEFENLPEGYYRIHVRADNHDDYYGIILIDAGTVNQQDIFISYHAVTYSWTVVPGEIQDEYDFILNTTFETNVPAPVITIDAPESIPDFEGSYNFNYIIINHGLIDAYDVVLHTPEDEDFLFTVLLENVDTLQAQDTIVIPCEVTRLPNNTSICKHWVKSWVNYNYTSGPHTIYKYAHDYTLVGTEQCGTTPPPASGGGSGAPGFFGGWGGGSGSPSLFINNIPVSTPSGSVNVQVGVQFNQHLVMTREAFFGTFSVHNGFDNAPLSNIGLNFTVKDENGIDCTNLFQINTLSLHNIDSINGNGTLDAGQDGVAQIVFIPTKSAAPTEPKDYYFGGTFTFYDPYFANTLVCDLYPVKLTVHPSPDLYVDYFMQRDIIGDDALTEDVVEPSVPAELAVIINNKGAGMAKNVTLETAEPMIVENSQGLLINFSMYSTSFNGNEAQLGLVGIPFGNIESGHTAVGEWQFISSLLGHFVSYEAHVIHNNSYDNPELSLISHLDIHELIHPIRAYGSLEDGINDFLVNDVPDEHNYPDSIYFSNGGRTGVSMVNSISCDIDTVTPLDTIVTLTVNPSRAGWNYGVVNDPGSDYVLIRCRRNSDNQIIPLQNVWQTFVTLHDGQNPVYENKLHIVDTLSALQTVTYTLTYAVNPPEPSHTPVGAIDGLFSVSDSQKVYFSQGNLQYQATTNTWRFADNQWDYVGDANSNIGQNYSGWIDLFGWGTSGYHNSNDPYNVNYQPWSTSTSTVNSDYNYWGYGPSTNMPSPNLTGSSANYDWGIYNPINNGGNQPNQWRTLTGNEWTFVFDTRTTASGIRYAKANVNNRNGVILLPDNWNTSYYTLNNTNTNNASFSSNTITASEWSTLEQHGAVFLPVAGARQRTSVSYVESGGYYWSVTYVNSESAYSVQFTDGFLSWQVYNPRNRSIGFSVRLARIAQDNGTYTINTICSPAEGGTVTGAGTYQQGQTCTLTATANSGYTFSNWTENGNIISTNANYNFTVTGNRTLVANFTYNSIGDHDYVDLGLPSGTLWATCNVGADTPEGCGDYFAWGEIQTKTTFSWSNYQYCNGSQYTLTKYCNNPDYGYNSFTDNLISLLSEDDAATANWGTDWRMPTDMEWEELYQNTTSTWTTQNGVNGRLFTSTNGNSLFLPVVGSSSDYWSSSLHIDSPNCAMGVGINSNQRNWGKICSRSWGQFVRPVRSGSLNNTPTGALNGIFSVSDSRQVYFSQGNLQYQASTNTWRFAENQWDCLGFENANISSSYEGWIDLFGWGTSGYDHGAVCYQPWSTSWSSSDYYAYGSYENNLYDQTGKADWGYNAISNGGNAENQWRTLTSDEWSYLLMNRNTPSGIRFAKAIVNYVEGLVVLPDNWDASYYSLNETNNTSANYSTNIIAENDWMSVLEPHGALFLPAGSYRGGTSVESYYNPFKGYYWTSSCSNDYAAIRVEFNNTQLMFGNRMRNHGLSVRLAKTIQHRFITTGNWSTPSNWLGGILPGANDEVFIDAPCQLDQNATVAALTVSNGQSLTLQSGKTLTVTGNLINTATTGLVIEDGAQLVHNVANVQATVKKLISPFNGTDDGWHLIALPLTGTNGVDSVAHLLEGQYDLYGYDESTTYWKNQKHTESGFTTLEATKGYLYANGAEVTLGFSGTLKNSSTTVSVPLSYTDGAHLSGFNLVGNPFPCNAYIDREYYVLTTDGTDINPEPIPANTPIPPCTAVFVKADAEGETVVFTRVAP